MGSPPLCLPSAAHPVGGVDLVCDAAGVGAHEGGRCCRAVSAIQKTLRALRTRGGCHLRRG